MTRTVLPFRFPVTRGSRRRRRRRQRRRHQDTAEQRGELELERGPELTVGRAAWCRRWPGLCKTGPAAGIFFASCKKCHRGRAGR